MKEIEKHGQLRYYFNLVSFRDPIPSVENIISDEKRYKDFTYHVTLNPEGVNWKIYHFQFNRITYKSFIYAFAEQLRHLNNSCSYCSQFEDNAKRLQKVIKKNKIILSKTESQVLKYATSFCSITLLHSDISDIADNLCCCLALDYL